MATEVGKSNYAHEEYDKSPAGSSNEYPLEFTPREHRKIVHRIDRRLVTMVGLMYCVSLMDRTNLSVAVVAGMEKDLRLDKGFRYSLVTLVFFPTYILFQIPSTIIVRALGPRLHLGTITIVWGAIMIAMGFVKTWSTLAGLRVILGVLEAGFFPSCVYLLSTWYTRYEMGKRYSFFYILGCVASAFSGILAFGIMQLKGRAGLSGWRWIFVLEGIITCGLGVLGYWLLVGFPDDGKTYWKFLTQRETKFIVDRVNEDRGDASAAPFSFKAYLVAAKDPKIWLFAMLFFDTTTITYALAYFLPVILKSGLHFNTAMAQCMIAPPYVFAGLIMWLTGWAGDKYRLRGPIIVFNMLLCVIGLPIVGWHKHNATRYFGIFLVTAGANANVPAVMTYQANNIRGQWKRAFCSATLVGFGGIGGIAGSLVFRSQDKPRYRPGMWACIACALLNIIIIGILTLKFKRDNKKAEEGKIVIEGSEEGFRYTY